MSEYDLPRILWVDDDASQLKMFTRRLGLRLNGTIVACSTLADGLEAVRQGQSFDVVITDMHFGSGDPEGGLRLLEFVRSKYDNLVPVIVLTAYGKLENAIKCMERGAFTYVEKGLQDDGTMRLLFEKTKRAIESSRSEFELRRHERQIIMDLEQARTYQLSLLPNLPIVDNAWRVEGWVEPSSHVGGDNFLIEPIGKNTLMFCFYDVSGHGVRSALISGMLRSTIYQSFRDNPNPEVIVGSLHRDAHYLTLPYFATLVYGIVFPDGLIRYFSAGHPHMFHTLNNHAVHLAQTGPVLQSWNLGLDCCQVAEIHLPLGERLVIFSDGLLECKDRLGEELGLAGIERACLSAEKNVLWSASVRATFDRHAAGTEVEDDASVLIIWHSDEVRG